MEESFWVKILIVILITAIVVLTIYNIVIYGKIANEGITVGDVTPDGARALMWFNIIIVIIALIVWFWYLYKIFRNDQQRKLDYEYLQNYAKQQYTKTSSSFKSFGSRMNSPMKRPVPASEGFEMREF